MTKIRIQKRHLVVFAAIIAVATVGAINIGSSYEASVTSNLASVKITPEVAATIAINHLGTQSSNLVKVDLDKENGSFLYSVEFVINNQEVSVEIDPQTGQVLVVEQHPVGESDTNDENDGADENDDNESADENDGPDENDAED